MVHIIGAPKPEDKEDTLTEAIATVLDTFLAAGMTEKEIQAQVAMVLMSSGVTDEQYKTMYAVYKKHRMSPKIELCQSDKDAILKAQEKRRRRAIID